MNTIPVTNDYDRNYERENFSTGFSYVLSGKAGISNARKNSLGIVLLHDVTNKNIVIENVLKEYDIFQSDTIIFANSDGSAVNAQLHNLYPRVNFFSLDQYPKEEPQHKKQKFPNLSVGSLLNILFSKIETDLVFVSWTDVNPYGISTSMFPQHVDKDSICLVPVLEKQDGSIVPSSYKPSVMARQLKISINEEAPLYPYTFVPHNFVGIYDRQKVLSVDAFDNDIKDSLWQLCDFGIRSYCKGYHMRINPYYRVRVSSQGEVKMSKKNEMYELMCIKHSFSFKHWFRFKHTLRGSLHNLIFRRPDASNKVLERMTNYSKGNTSTQAKNIHKKTDYFFKAAS